MNLYNYHNEQTKLIGHNKQHVLLPVMAFHYIKANGPASLDYKIAMASICKDHAMSLAYALDTGKPFPEGEAAIIKDAASTYKYVRQIIDKPWPKGEAAIAKEAHTSYNYAKFVLHHRFKLGEAAILAERDLYFIYYYAEDVIDGPWPECEDIIAEDAEYSYWYAKFVLQAPFPKGETAINGDISIMQKYNAFVKSLGSDNNN
jgi:lambda repressor-like predicted transcriptional regulator